MTIGSPPITWDLKHTGELWVYIGVPLPNPSGNTGMVFISDHSTHIATFRYLFLFFSMGKSLWAAAASGKAEGVSDSYRLKPHGVPRTTIGRGTGIALSILPHPGRYRLATTTRPLHLGRPSATVHIAFRTGPQGHHARLTLGPISVQATDYPKSAVSKQTPGTSRSKHLGNPVLTVFT